MWATSVGPQTFTLENNELEHMHIIDLFWKKEMVDITLQHVHFPLSCMNEKPYEEITTIRGINMDVPKLIGLSPFQP